MALYGSGSAPKTEFLINGVWTDLSSRPRENSRITITRGRLNEQGRAAPQTAQFTANNRDGVLTNRNPNSPYYRLLPRNTQVRISAGVGDSFVRLPMDYNQLATDRAGTVDVSALDVVGDIEVRADIWPATWRPRQSHIIASKYQIGSNQRSWVLYLSGEGKLLFAWTTDGTSGTRITATSTVAIPASTTRLSVKATLDVVNGANKTVEFWTAPSIDGTYTQLGTSVTTAGTTSIFSSSAPLTLGQGADNVNIFTDADAFRGKIYRFRMYNGIGGTVVANPDFSAQAVGVTSFVDSASRTWTITGAARVTSDRLRFWGELAAPPIQSDVSGRDVYIPVTAAGPLRRLAQGSKALKSPIYRALISRTLTGYSPLEDASGADSPANVITGSFPGSITGGSFGTDATLPGTQGIATLSDAAGKLIMRPATTPNTGTWYFTMYFKIPALPATISTLATLGIASASPRKVTIGVGPSTFFFDFIGSDNISIGSSNIAFGAGMNPAGQWMAINILVETISFVTNYSVRWSNVAAQTFIGAGPIILPGEVGRVSQVTLSAAGSPSFVGSSFAHVHTATNDLDFVDSALAQAANAYLLETAGARLQRLAVEEDINLEVWGDPAETEQMGYQTTASATDLMNDCADVDMGILGESKESNAVLYRTREDLGPRADVTLSLTGTHLTNEIIPTEDDAGLVNDVTVNRTGGSSGRREITTGFMSVSDPPAGIGRYAVQYNLASGNDYRLNDLASWIACRGSIDQFRVPKISVGLHRAIIQSNADLAARVTGLNVGDTIILTGMPAWLPPDDIPLLVQGYTETLGHFLWEINWNTTPAEIYNIGRYNYETINGISRYDHKTSTVGTGFNSSATSISVALNSSTPTTLDRWTTTASNFPAGGGPGLDIMIGGERMLVTAVTGTTDPQTFTVTRAINGISKAHVAGERVRLFRPAYWRL